MKMKAHYHLLTLLHLFLSFFLPTTADTTSDSIANHISSSSRNTNQQQWVKKAEFESVVSSGILSMSYPFIALGAPTSGENGADSGEVCIYKYDETKEMVIHSSSATACLRGLNPGDKFGSSIAMNRANPKRVVIGAPGVGIYENMVQPDYVRNRGKVMIYEYNSLLKTWILMQEIDGKDANEQFGSLVSMSNDGKFMAVGNHPYSSSASAHRVRMYLYDDASKQWKEFGKHSLSYSSSSRSSNSADRFLSDIAVLFTETNNYVVGYTSSNFQTSEYASLQRLYMYNRTLDEWDQVGEDDYCYQVTSNSYSYNYLRSFDRNVITFESSSESSLLTAWGCPGTSTGPSPKIYVSIIGGQGDTKSVNPTIDLPAGTNYVSNGGMKISASEDLKTLAVFVNSAVHIYVVSESMDSYVLRETITSSAYSMAFSDDTLVIGFADKKYVVYQNIHRQPTTEEVEEETTTSKDESGASNDDQTTAEGGGKSSNKAAGKNADVSSSRSSSSSQVFQRVILFSFIVMIGIAMIVMVTKREIIIARIPSGWWRRSSSDTSIHGTTRRTESEAIHARLHTNDDGDTNTSNRGEEMTHFTIENNEEETMEVNRSIV